MVRPLAVARCDLDVAMAAFGIFPGPLPVGHEIAAEIVDVGPGVRRFKPGQRVAVLEMYTRGITFHTSRADSRRHLPEVLDLVAAGRIDPLAVPTTVVDWDDAGSRWMEPALKMVSTR